MKHLINKLTKQACACLFTSLLVAGCATHPFAPVSHKNTQTIGWRGAPSSETQPYAPAVEHTFIPGSFLSRQLISVQPGSYCAIGNLQKYTRNVVTLRLDAHLYDALGAAGFEASKNISVMLNNRSGKVLPSSLAPLAENENIGGDVWMRLPGRLSQGDELRVTVDLGNDHHIFYLTLGKRGFEERLAEIPYRPRWEDKKPEPVVVRPKEPKEEVGIIKDITKEIKNSLKKDLDLYLAELRAQKALTENTQVDVNAEVVPELTEKGYTEYNMKVRYDVQVLPNAVRKLAISNITDDWGPGKYLLKDSKAALQTAGIIKKSIEDKLEPYIIEGTKVTVKIIGSTDATPFSGTTPYNNVFGPLREKEYFINGAFGYVTITEQTGINTNEQLAYLRTLDIHNFMKNHIGPLRIADCRYEHFAEIAQERGAEYRKVAVEITIHNAFTGKYPEVAPEKSDNSFERTAEVDTDIPQGKQVQNDAVAVIIGNAKYVVPTGKQGSTIVPDVKYAINDATTMNEYLTKTLGVKPENIIFLKNAYKNDFDRVFGADLDTPGELDKLVEKANAKTVYFFYSGHGYPFMGQSYLLGVASNPKNCKEQAMSLNYIYQKLGQLPVEHINVLLDACFSGQGISMEASGTEFAIRPKPDKLAKYIILSAAAEDQYANWYKDKRHGVFSYVLFKAMQNKGASDTDNNGVLTFEELYRYLADDGAHGVPCLVRELEGEQVKQTPVMQGSKRVQEPFVQY